MTGYDGDVVVAAFDLERGDWTGAESVLDKVERARAARFRFDVDRRQYVRSHAALRAVLGRVLEVAPERLRFSVGPRGRPEVEGGGCRFSLSHAGGRALVALTLRRALGVDLEVVRAGPEREVRRFLSVAEQQELASLPRGEQQAAFFRAWVRKEAWLKARGTGLTEPLDAFDVSLAPGAPAELRATRPDAEEAKLWTLHDLPAPPGFLAALAIERGPVHFLSLPERELPPRLRFRSANAVARELRSWRAIPSGEFDLR